MNTYSQRLIHDDVSASATSCIGLVLCAILIAFVGLSTDLLLWWSWDTFAHPIFRAPILTFWQVFAAVSLLGILSYWFKQIVPARWCSK